MPLAFRDFNCDDPWTIDRNAFMASWVEPSIYMDLCGMTLREARKASREEWERSTHLQELWSAVAHEDEDF